MHGHKRSLLVILVTGDVDRAARTICPRAPDRPQVCGVPFSDVHQNEVHHSKCRFGNQHIQKISNATQQRSTVAALVFCGKNWIVNSLVKLPRQGEVG